MLPINTHYPRRAIFRIRSQTLQCPRLKSCQQETYLRASNYADVGTFLLTPGAVVHLVLDDTDQILPYTTIEFDIKQDVPVPSAPFVFGLFLLAIDNTRAKAALTLASQINILAGFFGKQFRDMSSMRAVAQGDNVIIYMPWGVLGPASGFYTGPEGVDGFTSANPGVDNPLIYGILGKRRHISLARFPFRDDYYGESEQIIG